VLKQKLAVVALSAADKSTKISNVCAKQTLAKLNNLFKNSVDWENYSKSLTDFSSMWAEMAAVTLTAYAKIA
tara:strand:- start:195 stop:410 length:216 start_codon:yes stop_codon:yes gene_type:complete